MAQTSFPEFDYNAGGLTEPEFERVAARFSDDGVDGNPTSAAVVSTGVGLTVVVAADEQASVRGFHWESGSVAYTHDIAPNASGQTRVDRVILRLDRSTWEVRSVVKEGTPGSGSPAVVRQESSAGGTVWEIPLARVSVPNNATSVSVTRDEQYIGGRCRPCTSSTRPILPRRGDQIFETDTGRWRGFNGTDWDLLYSYSGVVVVDGSASPWDVGGVSSVLEERSGIVELRLGTWERTGGNLGGGNESRLPVLIPAAYRHPNRNQYGTVYIAGSGAGSGRVTVYAANSTEGRAGGVWLTHHTGVNSGSSVLAPSISWVVD